MRERWGFSRRRWRTIMSAVALRRHPRVTPAMSEPDGSFKSFTPIPSPLPLEDAADEAPVQFTLRTLLLLQLLCAIFCGLLVTVGIFAVLALFVGGLLFAAVRVRPENAPLKRMAEDLLFLRLPADLVPGVRPGVVAGQRPGLRVRYRGIAKRPPRGHRHSDPSLSRLAAGRLLDAPVYAALSAGLLWGGTILAGMIALAMSPLSLLGLIAYGIGALGFTPIFTSIAFGRNAAAAGAGEGRPRAVVADLLRRGAGDPDPSAGWPAAGAGDRPGLARHSLATG